MLATSLTHVFCSSHASLFPGAKAHPLFGLAKKELGGGDIEWNFEKFLFLDGKPVKRYPEAISVAQIEVDVKDALDGKAVSKGALEPEEEEDYDEENDDGSYEEEDYGHDDM